MVSQPEHAYHQIISTNNQSDQINPGMQTRLPVPTMQPQNIPQNNQSSVMSPHMSDTASMKTESPADVKNQMPNTPGSMNSMSLDGEQRNASIVSASKVAEVLKVAGEAFQRLGECTMFLDFHSVNNKSKWMPSDVDKLQEAVANFKDDLGTISNTMQKRTSQKLKENLHKHFGNSVNNRIQNAEQMTKKPRMQQVVSPGGQTQQPSQLRSNSMNSNQQHLQKPMQQQGGQQHAQQQQMQSSQQHQLQQNQQQQQGQPPQQQQQPRLSGSVPMSPGQNQNQPLQMQRGHSQQNLQHIQRSAQSSGQVGSQPSNYIVQSPGSGQRLIQTSQHQHQQQQSESQQQQSPRVVSANNIGTATTMVLGSDQQKGGQQYTVKQTIIDGKRTLILDHSDLQRLISSNSGNAPASLILPTTSSVDSIGQNQTVMVMTSQQGGNQNGARQNQ